MTGDEYLRAILARERVDTSPTSPLLGVRQAILPIIQAWAGSLLVSFNPSGSFAKGTANSSGTDIDLFISLSSSASETLKEIYNSLTATLGQHGYTPRQQNVSIGITVNRYDVDLVPAKRQDHFSNDHSLYRRRADTWTKTNVSKHINLIAGSGRTEEIRIVKLWRKQKGLDFPSFYLELAVLAALAGKRSGDLAANVWSIFEYLRTTFPSACVLDPANTSNVISDDLASAGKNAIASAANVARAATQWEQVVK